MQSPPSSLQAVISCEHILLRFIFQLRQRRADAGVDGLDGAEGHHALRPLHHPARVGRGGRRRGRGQPCSAGTLFSAVVTFAYCTKLCSSFAFDFVVGNFTLKSQLISDNKS